MVKVTVVLPTYNEAKTIKLTIKSISEELRKAGISYSITVIDDSSPDGTADIAASLSSTYPVNVVRRIKKEGIGSAYIHAIGYVIEGGADVMVAMDADGSHPATLIPTLVGELISSGSDVVVASRYIEGGSYGGLTLARKVYSIVANMLVRMVTRMDVKDSTSGFRAYRVSSLKGIEVKGLAKGFAFQPQILYEMCKKGMSVKEVPLKFKKRHAGSSKLNFKEVASFALWLARVLLNPKAPR